MPVAGGLWSGLASRLQRVYAVPIAPRAVVVGTGTRGRGSGSVRRSREPSRLQRLPMLAGFATGEMEAIFRQ